MSNATDVATALDTLPFVQVVEAHDQDGMISLLCRVSPKAAGYWANLAEYILREAEARNGRPDYWFAHISRLYVLKEGKFAFAWSFVIAAQDIDVVCPIIIELIQKYWATVAPKEEPPPPPKPVRQEVPLPAPPRAAVKQEQAYEYAVNSDPLPGEDEDYTDADEPLPPGHVPEADEMGNPIVPRAHRIRKVLMAGLPKDFDRNAPDPEKGRGSWKIETRKGKSFRPPVRR